MLCGCATLLTKHFLAHTRISMAPSSWVIFLLVASLATHASAATFTVRNNCGFTVRPAAIPVGGGTHTTGFEVFTESGIPHGEGPFPLTEAFTESLLSVKASRWTLYQRRTLRRELSFLLTVIFTERPIWFSVKKIL
jgi:hypothetical protein